MPDFAKKCTLFPLNVRMKTLAGDRSPSNNSTNSSIKAIQRSTVAPSDAVIATTNSLISTATSGMPVYMWYTNGTIKWWSEAEKIEARTDLSYLCAMMYRLTDISGLSDWNTGAVTDMSYMFSGDSYSRYSSLTNLSALLN